MDRLTVAAAQFHGHMGDREYNYAQMERLCREAKAQHGADLVLFPEAALTGYCTGSPGETLAIGEPLGGEYVKKLRALSAELDMDIAFGMIENAGDKSFNTLVLAEPDGNFGYYHKLHLPYLGADRFVERGDTMKVMDTRFGKIGLMICYDVRFPETARVLALSGARLILHPSYMSTGTPERNPDVLTKARALENRVFLLYCNTVGDEGGFTFFGRSQIIDTSGYVIKEAGGEEQIISAPLDLSVAEIKKTVSKPGEAEISIFEDRLPDMYGKITEK